MEDAEDAEDYRGALAGLVLGAELPAGGRDQATQQLLPTLEQPEGFPNADELSKMVHELQGLKLLALSKRALSMGIDAESVEEAMDADDGRSALIALIVSIESSRGPAERMVSALEGGGEASADIVVGVLDHAMSVLEHLSVSCARKSRKVIRALLERTEAISEVVDAEWCDGVSMCSVEDLRQLGSLLITAQGVSVAGAEASEVSSAVGALLEWMSRCGSVVVQSASTLMRSHGDDGGMGRSALLGALESLRGLSESRLESVCADEAAAYEAVKSHLSGLESCVGAEVVSTCMALFTLGCRNGLSVCGTVDMVELSSGMYIKWYEAASGVDAVDYAGQLFIVASDCNVISLRVFVCVPNAARVSLRLLVLI